MSTAPAEKAHKDHGYTYLGDETDGDMPIMHFQDGTRNFSEDEVSHLFKQYW